jgi:hypothetical protein
VDSILKYYLDELYLQKVKGNRGFGIEQYRWLMHWERHSVFLLCPGVFEGTVSYV